jgi:hypothetical protein
MQIGHTGKTRVEELVLAGALLIIALRTALPIHGGSAAYGNQTVKLLFAALIAIPGMCLLLVRTLATRKRALLWVFVTYAYIGTLVPIVDWTRFGSAAALLTLAVISGHLYYVTAREIRWTQAQSSLSSPPSAPDLPSGE